MWRIMEIEGGVIRGTQREYSSKPLKHSIIKRSLVSYIFLSPKNFSSVQIS